MSDEEPVDTAETVEQIAAQVLATVREQLTAEQAAFEKKYAAVETAATNAVTGLGAKATKLTGELTAKLAEVTAQEKTLAASTAAAAQTVKAIQEQSTESKTALDTVNTNRNVVVSLGERADELNTQITNLQQQVRAARDNASTFQKDWAEKYNKLFETIEELLPGATGAGLASGFREEKLSYEGKQRIAMMGFGACLLFLIFTLAFAPIQFFFGTPSGSASVSSADFLVKMLWNLPLVVPAAWGAWWFNRNAHTYDRLAEEYRQKEAISNAFDGYTKHLEELDNTKALNEYLERALKEICVPAGRIYDKKLPAGSPLEDNIEKIVVAVVKAMNPTQPS